MFGSSHQRVKGCRGRDLPKDTLVTIRVLCSRHSRGLSPDPTMSAEELAALLETRTQARRNGDFEEADRIRRMLEADGWIVVDELVETYLRPARPWMQNPA